MASPKKLLHGVIICAVIAGVAGCSSDKNTSTGPGGGGNGGNGGTAPDFSVSTVDVPDALLQSTAPGAQLTIAYITQANAISTWTGFFTPPPGTAKLAVPATTQAGPWIYNWSDATLNIKLTITEDAQKYTWSLVYDGSEGNRTYDEFEFMYAERYKDQALGSMVVNDLSTGLPIYSWDWSVGANDVYSFITTIFGSQLYSITLLVNPNQSGSLEYLEDNNGTNNLIYRSAWATDGSGEWWDYANGEVNNTGTW